MDGGKHSGRALTLRRAALILGVGVLYVVAGKLGLRFAFVHASATAVWPPTGIALAALLVLGRDAWPAIFVGAFLVNLTTAGSVVSSLGIALGNTLEAVLGATLVARFAGGASAFRRAQDIFKFIVLAGVVSTAVSATVGVGTLTLTGLARPANFGAIWLTWWLGDLVGDLVVAPLLLLWSETWSVRALRARWTEAVLVVVAVMGTGLVVFGGLLPPGMRHYPVAFVCIPPLLWAAFRFGQREAATLIAVFSAIAVAGTLRGLGAFALAAPNEALLLVQGFIATMVLAVMPLSALVWERRRAETALRRREQRMTFLGEIARSMTSSLDLDTVLQRIVEGAKALSDGDNAAIFLRDDASGEMVPRYRAGPRLPAYRTLRIRPREGIGGHVMVTKRPIRTDRYLADERVPPAFHAIGRETGTVALMVVPILTGDEVAGLLYISNQAARPFTAEDETVCVRLAEQAAVAIQNARLFAEQHAARAEAEAASRAKDDFLAMLSHELRNPLGAIGIAAEVLSRSADPAVEPVSRAHDVIQRQVRNLGRLVDDLLDVSRVVSGKITLQREPVDLGALARRVVEVHTTAESAGRRIRCEAEPVWASADPTRLEQIVANLVENATKYTPPVGDITVTVRREGDEAVLTVADTGVGIAPDLLPRVFDLFVQGDRSLARTQGGLGIGLTLVRRLVDLHGGRVEAASAGENCGATFTLRLPVTAPPPPGASPEPTASGPRRRVLIVEDNDDSREMLRTMLTLLGHEVHEAADGAAGADAALRLRPDATLVDLGLPGMDGYAVARRIRSTDGGSDLFLVAVTGYGLPEDRDRARAAGFDLHLVKPVAPDTLTHALATPRGAALRDRRSGPLPPESSPQGCVEGNGCGAGSAGPPPVTGPAARDERS